MKKELQAECVKQYNRYAEANNKYMKNHDKNIESSHLMYLDANNFCGWAMSQKRPVNGFKWVKNLLKFNESFIKGYDENIDKGYFLEVGVEYPKQLLSLHSDFTFLLERSKIKKWEKLVCNIQDKKKYVVT